MTADQKKSFIEQVSSKQQADGGWSLSSLSAEWARQDKTALPSVTDGYATALISLALESAGVSRDQPELKKGLDWLRKNQNKDRLLAILIRRTRSAIELRHRLS